MRNWKREQAISGNITAVNLLHYPQRPIVKSFTQELFGEERSSGQNIVIAVMNYEGYNMSDAQDKYQELNCLLTDLMEGTISKEQFGDLQKLLSEDQSMLAYYVEFMALWAHLDQIGEVTSTLSPDPDEVDDPLTAEFPGDLCIG